MRYVAAYLLTAMGGKSEPNLDDMKKLLGSVGIDCDAEKANMVLNSLAGKNLEEVIASGREKLASVPSGGGAAAAAPAAAGGGAAEEKPAEKEAPKEESEEEDEDMGLGLFD